VAVAGAVVLVVRHADLAAVWTTILHARPGWLLVAVLLQCASLSASVLLQRSLLRRMGAVVSLRSVWRTVVLADAIAATLPVAGSAVAVAFSYREFRRERIPARTAALTPLLATVLSLVGFVDLAALGSLLSGRTVPGLLGLLVLAAEIAVLIAVSPHERAVTRSSRLRSGASAAALHRLFVSRLGAPADGMRRSLDPGTLAVGVLWGGGRWIADAMSLAAVVQATGPAVPWDQLVLAWAASAAITALGLSPSGVGPADAALVGVLVSAGLVPAAAVAAAVLYRAVLLKPLPRILGLIDRHRRPAGAVA
jgi:uncharacterized membrane protein YbhN (UPF0104 family)